MNIELEIEFDEFVITNVSVVNFLISSTLSTKGMHPSGIYLTVLSDSIIYLPWHVTVLFHINSYCSLFFIFKICISTVSNCIQLSSPSYI